jgi:heme A synthase
MVAVHFLLSSAILAAAVTLYARAGEEAGPAYPPVRTDLRILAGLLAAATGLMRAAGTVVTGSGALAGTVIDSGGHRTTVPRFGFRCRTSPSCTPTSAGSSARSRSPS